MCASVYSYVLYEYTGPVRDDGHRMLDEAVRMMAMRRRDPGVAPFSPEPLVNALNECLNHASRFNIRLRECALEFLFRLWQELDLRPEFLISHVERGSCQGCRVDYEQVMEVVENKC
jgi:hypothetical protein